MFSTMEASSTTKSSSGMDLRVISLSETTEEAFLQKVNLIMSCIHFVTRI